MPEADDRTADGSSARRLVVSLDPRSMIGVVVGLFGLFLLLDVARTTVRALTLVGVGVLLAFALEPLVKGVQRRLHCARAVGVAAVGMGLFVVVGTLAFVMGPPALRQAERFGSELPQTVRDLYDVPVAGPRLESADAAGRVKQWARDLPGQFDSERVGDTARRVVGGLTSGFTVILVALVVLLDGEVLVRRARQIIPPRFRDRADGMGRVFYRVVGTYFAGSLLVACIGGSWVLAVGLALGVPLAPVAAVWYALASLIPQIGGFLGTSFFFVLAISQGVVVGLVGLALVVAYMNTENYVISPAIVGHSVNLSPPTTMLAALIGGAAVGVPGALAAIPLCGTVKALYLEYRFGAPPEIGRSASGILGRIKLPGFLRHRLARRRGRPDRDS